MKDKIQKAIFNNNDLYEEIFSQHQINFHRTDSVCYSLEKTPPLYSNLVTVSKDWKPDEIFRKIDLDFEKENWNEWSIKDSFNLLNLKEFGFEKLFDANWIYLESANFNPAKKSKNLHYKIIDSENDLSKWRMAWDFDERLGKEIFSLKLLDNPRVYFVAGYEDNEIVCGCFVNKTDDFLGISNFFAPKKAVNYWSDTVRFIFDSIKRADIVGYERKELVDKLQELGFEATGNLSVWLKKKINK